MRILYAMAAAALMLFACATTPNPAAAGAKLIRVGAGAMKAHRARIHRPGRGRLKPGFTAFVPDVTVIYPYYRSWRPWIDRNYLRRPELNPLNRALQGHIGAGPTIPIDASPYRQRIRGGLTVERGSRWAGTFQGGRTVEQGSPWRSHIRY